MLVRVESPGSKLDGGMVVLELVGRHGRTADWIVRKRSITSVNATATVVGGTDPPRVARFRLLAFGVLGMDRRNGGLSLSLRGSFSYSRTSSRNGAFAHRGLTWSGAASKSPIRELLRQATWTWDDEVGEDRMVRELAKLLTTRHL